ELAAEDRLIERRDHIDQPGHWHTSRWLLSAVVEHAQGVGTLGSARRRGAKRYEEDSVGVHEVTAGEIAKRHLERTAGVRVVAQPEPADATVESLSSAALGLSD